MPGADGRPCWQGSYSGSDEEQILAWLGEVTGQPELVSGGWPDALTSGVALCELANALRPKTIPKKKISRSPKPFPQRENIRGFIEAARGFGVEDRDIFDTDDLFEAKNLSQVVLCCRALGRAAYSVEGYAGPCLGKKPAAAKADGAKKHAEVASADGLWGKAGGDVKASGAPADGIIDAVSTEWQGSAQAAEGTAAALAQQMAAMAPDANLAERDAANAEGVDASAVAAAHYAQSQPLPASEWMPCMVRAGTAEQGWLHKLPSKRAAVHGWQKRWVVRSPPSPPFPAQSVSSGRHSLHVENVSMIR